MVHQMIAVFELCGAIGEKGNPRPQFRDCKIFRHHCGLSLLLDQEVDDGFSVVCPTGATDLVKLRVEQLIQPITTAPNAGVVELDFECLEFLK